MDVQERLRLQAQAEAEAELELELEMEAQAASANSPSMSARVFDFAKDSVSRGPMLAAIERLPGGYVQSLAQGATLGFADEAAAGARAGIVNPIKQWWTGQPQANYEQELEALRSELNQTRSDYPVGSGALEMVGSVPSSLAIPAVRGASAVARMGKAAGIGGAMGAAYGFGSGENDARNRAANAAVSGAVGTAMGGAGQGIAETVAPLVSRVVRGKTPVAAKVVQEATQRVPDNEIASAQALMQQAKSEKSPVFLAEALEDDNVFALAKDIANRPETRREAQAAIINRTSEAFGRIDQILDDVSPVKSPVEASKWAQMRAAQVIDEMEDARHAAVGPMYKAAHEAGKNLQSEKLDKLLGSADEPPNLVRSIINDLQKKFPEFREEPVNSSRMLNEVLGELNARINLEQNAQQQRRLLALKSALEDEVEKLNPLLKDARETYAKMSPAIDAAKASRLGVLEDLKADNIQQAGNKIFQLAPERIEELKQSFGSQGQAEFSAVVRAFLQERIEGTQEGRNALRGLLNTEKGKRQLEAALGKQQFKRIYEKLNREFNMFEAKNRYRRGSDTMENIDNRSATNKTLGAVNRMFRFMSRPKDSIQTGLDRKFSNPDPRTLDAVREALFSTDGGLQTLQEVQKLRQARSKDQITLNAISRALGAGGAVTGSRVD